MMEDEKEVEVEDVKDNEVFDVRFDLFSIGVTFSFASYGVPLGVEETDSEGDGQTLQIRSEW